VDKLELTKTVPRVHFVEPEVLRKEQPPRLVVASPKVTKVVPKPILKPSKHIVESKSIADRVKRD
jgi:hypothetical protein